MVGLVRFIKELQKDEGLILEPKYKLKTLWCEGRQKDYLEYVLRGGKEGVTIYLNNRSWNNHVVKKTLDFELVDGLQRYSKSIPAHLKGGKKV